MDSTERVTQLRQPHRSNGQSDEIVIRPEAEAAEQRRRQAQLSTPIAVSESSYLNEKDRHFRAAETVMNAIDLAERSANGMLRLDARLREAQAEGASPRALAGIERLEEVLSHGTCALVFDFVSKPYERW